MREHWMDNLRWGVILLVVLFHVVCMFNSCDMPLGVGRGVPAFDLLGYFVYPWFMALMFLLAGIGARRSLNARRPTEYLRTRAKRLLLPLLATLLLIAPLLCAFTWWNAGTSFTAMARVLPVPAVLLIAMLAGMGPQWFLLALFLYTLLLLPLCRLDGKGRCARAGWLALPGLAALYYVSSRLLPAPDRYVLYFAAFLCGYFVFSHEAVLQRVQKGRLPLLAAALLCFTIAAVRWWGVSFTDGGYLTDPATVLFASLACPAALGCARAWFNGEHPFLRERGFSLFLFHYLPMLVTAVFTVRLGLPPLLSYALTLAAAVAVPLVLHEVLKRTPVLGTAFGIRRKAPPTAPTPTSPPG